MRLKFYMTGEQCTGCRVMLWFWNDQWPKVLKCTFCRFSNCKPRKKLTRWTR